ncbi:hypothetical protein WA026_023264 [Henosepilachna vigintioctopunctata]|uniref:Kazal-like domain-containing protein n=1 Tax=Henosepilachna vigintioctopunctata TaxID=420089 RepID=A0AAW1V487_9CUCU
MLKYSILVTIVLLVHSVSSSSDNFDLDFNGKMSGLERMKDPKIKRCMESCPVTLNFLPQCASDGKSYPNASTIRCMNYCLKPFGEELTVTSVGFCKDDRLPSD